MIRPVHIKLPGRARYKVQGLYRSESLKKFLEFRLSQHKNIFRISASTLTANILVLFHSDNSHQEIASLIEDALGEIGIASPGQESAISRKAARKRPLALVQKFPLSETGEWSSRVKDTLTSLLHHTEKQESRPWHLIKREAILDLLVSDKVTGLSSDIARERLKRYGPNSLPQPTARSDWKLLMRQFMSLPVGLLGAAAGLSVLTGGILDAVVIMGVVAANAVIGFVTERKAERTIHSLRSYIRPSAQVIRQGQLEEVSSDELVPGDLIFIKPGTYIAADCRVLEASNLSVDESSLTGESMPVTKKVRALKRKKVPLGELFNMVHMGTLVTGGEGIAVVVATGRFTQIGQLQLLIEETTAPETPIERQLRRAGDQLFLLCAGICGVVFIIGFLRGHGFLQMMKMAISLAAAAVPEGLPAAATINFALGIQRMRKHHVIIRHLQAVETLGAVQTVCFDKTGTITWNRMEVLSLHAGMKRIRVSNGLFTMNGKRFEILKYEELRRLAVASALCNETKINGGNGNGDFEMSGSPTENALLLFAIQAGIDVRKLRTDYRLLNVTHRAENRLYMSALHKGPDARRFFSVKGSPPEVLAMCRWQLKDGEKIPLTDEDRLRIETENMRMAGERLRVLGFACTHVDGDSPFNHGEDLTWLGLVSMADPIREGVQELIHAFHGAGIDTVMITGDQSPTAYAVARELGLSKDKQLEILDSTQFEAVEPEVMTALARKVHVYSRVSPAHKLRIVQALQEAGKVVAMTGDGINDCVALKAADIGIAMGRSGTDVAREVADVVLEDDAFETLVVALRDGRTTYSNIRKSVHFFLSTNLSEIMVMFSAMALGIGFPHNVMQLLWINIISDIFPGLALSMEEPKPDVLNQPPRDPKAPLFSPQDYKRMARESAAISAGSLGAYAFGAAQYGMGQKAGSLAFQSLTIGQLLHALSCRSERHSLFEKNSLPSNRYLNMALGGSLALQLMTMVVPALRNFLGVAPLNLMDAAVIGGSALLPLAVNEITKNQSGDER